jgi:tetratricopeptide (TPR) repeat protein
MLKRLIIISVGAAIATLAVFFVVVTWIERREEAEAGKLQELRSEEGRRVGEATATAYKIDREGRRFADGPKTPENLKIAEEKFRESLEMFRELNHLRGQAEVLNDLGILYADLKNYDKALECYEESLALKRESGWNWGEGNTLTNLGGLYSQRDDYAKAIDYYEQAINAYKKTNSRGEAARVLIDLGRVYAKAGQTSKAMETVEKSLTQSREIKDLDTQMHALGELGTLYADQRQFSEAVPYFEECSEIARKIRKPDLEQWALYCLGSAHASLNNDSTAIEYYEKSLEVVGAKKEDLGRMAVLERLAHLYARAGKFPKAAELYLTLLESAEKAGRKEEEECVLYDLTMLCDIWALIDPGSNDLKRVLAILAEKLGKDGHTRRDFDSAI